MDVLWFNGRWTTTDEPVVRVEDRGLQFGDSIYEVLRFRRRVPFLVARHFARLSLCLEQLEIPNPWDFASFSALLRELIARSGFEDGLVYLQVTRGVAPRVHSWPRGLEPTALAYSRAFEFPSEEKLRSGVGVITLADNRWSRRDLKTTNLLANALARNAAATAGAGEVVYVDGDRVTECSSSSLLAVVEGALVTRHDGPEILPGTLRDAVLELAESSGFVVRRRPILVAELATAGELFITSTSQGVMPVVSVDGASCRQRGPVTERLQRLLVELELREIEEWRARAG